MRSVDVLIIGGGPAGLAAAIAARKNGAEVLLLEREARLGGILKQCIHDGFGLVRYGEKLSGPEYAGRFIDEFRALEIEALTLTFVTRIEKKQEGFLITAVNREGLEQIHTKALILATGCRERTAKQVSIHGTRPAGVFTAGTAQHFTNLLGLLPTKKCVILGSGDIGLIMARRLTLEGAEVLGVYEAKPTPSGLTRNLHQCLHDFNIPLHLSHTVTRVFGQDRLSAVEIMQVDERMNPIPGTAQRVECDALILSVGLIPENELTRRAGIEMDRRTSGPSVFENMETSLPGVFACGNVVHVHDLVDFVTAEAEKAGRSAAGYVLHGAAADGRTFATACGACVTYTVPQHIRLSAMEDRTEVSFRVNRSFAKSRVLVTDETGAVIAKFARQHMAPGEMEHIALPRVLLEKAAGQTLTLACEEVSE